MAAPSLALSACTAAGPATTSVASVSACQDSLEPCATKVLPTGGVARAGNKGAEGRKDSGSSLPMLLGTEQHVYGMRKKKSLLLKGQAQRG